MKNDVLKFGFDRDMPSIILDELKFFQLSYLINIVYYFKLVSDSPCFGASHLRRALMNGRMNGRGWTVG